MQPVRGAILARFKAWTWNSPSIRDRLESRLKDANVFAFRHARHAGHL